MQQWRSETKAMNFDEISMERSKGFVKALQELKNLRPQLYSAAEYCEKSYLYNEQKQMVLDNLKDYAVRVLVNAVDHLGTVAYKLTDLFEQQTLHVSTVELKISCLNQRLLTCQTYVDKEGLRQQQLLVAAPKHHMHYILPNSASEKVQRIQLPQSQANPQPHSQCIHASKTLSWHLTSEIKPVTNESSNATIGVLDSKPTKITSDVFHLLDPHEEPSTSLPLSTRLRSSGGTTSLEPYLVKDREVPKPLSAFRSFDNPTNHALVRAPARSKSMLSVFFAKSKDLKPTKAYAH